MLSLLRWIPPRVGIVLMVALALFTTHKLYAMCRIRGFFGTRQIEVHEVAATWTERDAKNRPFYVVSWAEDPRENDRAHRVEVESDYFETAKPGDRIEIVRYDGDNYVRGTGDVYTSSGNFIFDLVLFGVELVGILYYWSRAKERAA